MIHSHNLKNCLVAYMTKQATQQGILGSELYQPEKMCLSEKKELAEKCSNTEFKVIWPGVRTEQRKSTMTTSAC